MNGAERGQSIDLPDERGMRDATRILASVNTGGEAFQSAERLLPEIYAELRHLAAARLASERAGQTLQATALVHEAWLRIAGRHGAGQQWRSKEHFIGAAAEAMRRILIENARRKKALRHGGGQERLDVNELQISAPETPDELIALDSALHLLARQDPRKAELVKLRYFAGLTIEEAAEILKISVPTAKRHWMYARAWLFRKVRQMLDE